MPPFPPTITKKESHLAQTLVNKRPDLAEKVASRLNDNPLPLPSPLPPHGHLLLPYPDR